MVKQTALTNGCPNIRVVDAPRVGTGPERVATFIDKIYAALTTPLTSTEKESGTYNPPPDPRICFTGTLLDAQAFYPHVTVQVQGPIAQWTDGLPIIIPTEAAVKEMLTGTSHAATETIKAYNYNTTTHTYTQSANATVMSPNSWIATVEKVATIAVMAGCRPEYLPAVLAEATTGVSVGTTTFRMYYECVSGPFAKEVGMNSGIGEFDPGNQANATIGRSYQLMAINLGGAITGVNRMLSHGAPGNTGGMCFAENNEALPPGWLGYNEEMGYKNTESVIMCTYTSSGIGGNEYAPSSYRGLQGAGTGGMAVRLGVVGQPGPHNWLEYYFPALFANWAGFATPGLVWIVIPEMATDLYNYGFKTKQSVYDWLWKESLMPMSQYKTYGWYDFGTSSGTKIELTSGKQFKDLPDDYMVPAYNQLLINSKNCFNMLVAGGQEEEALHLEGGRTTYPIDPWK